MARAAGIAPSYLSDIELGRCDASRRALVRIAAVLGADLSERIFPNTGPRIRDRLQATILDSLLSILHARWSRHLEVNLTGRIRGIVDLVLVDPPASLIVSGEIDSGFRRLEQQIRWSHEKAAGIGEEATRFGAGESARTSRLMVVRSTTRTREVVRALPELFRAEFPAVTSDAYASLTGTADWPGPALVWARLEHGHAVILAEPPRGVRVGR